MTLCIYFCYSYFLFCFACFFCFVCFVYLFVRLYVCFVLFVLEFCLFRLFYLFCLFNLFCLVFFFVFYVRRCTHAWRIDVTFDSNLLVSFSPLVSVSEQNKDRFLWKWISTFFFQSCHLIHLKLIRSLTFHSAALHLRSKRRGCFFCLCFFFTSIFVIQFLRFRRFTIEDADFFLSHADEKGSLPRTSCVRPRGEKS